MKTRLTRWTGGWMVAVLLAAWGPLGARAETGATNVIDATTVNYTGTWMVGTNGPFNAQIVTNGGILAVTGDGIVGNSALAASNYAIVTGPSSLWSNSGQFTVGMTGAFNWLTITNGGQVRNAKGVVGYDGATNSVLVTGANSLWTNSNILVVGDHTAGNQLTILNSGRVVNTLGYIGYAASASNNAATVSGTGSVWKNTSDLYVGNNGAGNQLTITNGGQVVNTIGYIGLNSSASNNFALVTGSGSVWTDNGDFYVGRSGAGNQLIITNGGIVVSKYTAAVGVASSSSNNTIIVSGSGSLWISLENLLGPKWLYLGGSEWWWQPVDHL